MTEFRTNGLALFNIHKDMHTNIDLVVNQIARKRKKKNTIKGMVNLTLNCLNYIHCIDRYVLFQKSHW